MTALPDSALRACRQYQEAAAEIERLTREIGEALIQCPMESDDMLLENPHPKGSRTHLRYVYEAGVAGHYDARTMTHDEIEALLSGRWDLHEIGIEIIEPPYFPFELPDNIACPHCLSAHRLIQERKRARQQFGAAKRFVRLVGKKVPA